MSVSVAADARGRARRRWVVLAAAALLAFGLLPSPPRTVAGQTADSRPNVVLIVADDMRLDSLWAMAALNRIAERGTTFNNAFATTPLCCPSRATILTGLYAHHHGVRSNNPPLGGVEVFDDRSTVATWLQAAGIRTGLVGRYLNGYESEAVPPGWNYWFAMWQTGDGYSGYHRYRVTDHDRMRYYGSESKEYSTRVLGEQVKAFLQADRSTPFMLHFTPRTPHGPATPDRIDSGIFKDRGYALPPSYNEADVGDKPSFIREERPLSPNDLVEIEKFRRLQWESLLSLDRAITGAVDLLAADGRLANTWFIFSSDNGLLLGEHRRWEDKICAYEECVRVPLVIIPPPGVAVPKTDDHLVGNIDLAPTVAAIMGVEPPAQLDGRSLLPLLVDPATPWRDALLLEGWFENSEPEFVAIRTADRKYVRHRGGEDELYDYPADPYELDNRAADPARGGEKASLAERLDALLAEPPGSR